LHGAVIDCYFDAGTVVRVKDGRARSGYGLEAARTGKLIGARVLETGVFNTVVVGGRHVGNRTEGPEKAVVVRIK